MTDAHLSRLLVRQLCSCTRMYESACSPYACSAAACVTRSAQCLDCGRAQGGVRWLAACRAQASALACGLCSCQSLLKNLALKK